MSLSSQEWQGAANDRMVIVALQGRTTPRLMKQQFTEIKSFLGDD